MKEGFPQGLVLDKVVVIPHGVDINVFKPQSQTDKNKGSSPPIAQSEADAVGYTNKPSDEEGKRERAASTTPQGGSQANSPRPFIFLANKGFRNMEDRGGIQYLVQAYAEEFTPQDSVELKIKINPAYGVPNIQQMFKHLKNPPKISFIINELTEEQMNKLYNEADVFVSPTRAEAFNLPCLEAMACGKPVITTNFGGQTDYSIGSRIDYDLTPVQHELEYEGIKWATPSIKSLREALRSYYEAYTEDPKLIEEESIKAWTKAQEYPWSRTAKEIKELL